MADEQLTVVDIPNNPNVQRVSGVRPRDGMGGDLYKVDQPIVMSDGSRTSYVITSFGLETILGEGNGYAVFASDPEGRVLDWAGIYSDGEGPPWAAMLDILDDEEDRS